MSTVIEAVASGEDIQAFIDKIGPAIDGTPFSAAVAGMLIIMGLTMVPDITEDQLEAFVKDSSSYISTHLSLLNAPPTAVN